MKRKIPGYFITSTTIGEKVKAFVPNPLPPEPPLDTGMQAVHTTKQLVAIYTDDRNCINNLGRTAGSVNKVHQAFWEKPIITSALLVEKTELTAATVNNCLDILQKLGIAQELTGQKRNRLFSYTRYVEIMNKGTLISE